MQVRKAAIECIRRILHESVKADVAMQQAAQYFEIRERKLLHEYVYGVLRYCYSLEADFSRFCKSKPDPDVYAALAIGTYQQRHMRVPTHAAVSATVAAMQQLNPKAAGFVNAVLRRVSEHEAPAKLKPNQRAELPRWMYAVWRDAFGADVVQDFCQVLKQPPKLCLAVFVDRQDWMTQVQAMGIEAEAGGLSPFAVLLPVGSDVTALPGFDAGQFTVMDQAAQAAVMALDLPTSCDGVILDICAAPGGKTALLAHRFAHARIIAIELNAKRMPRLQENLSRLHCDHVEVLQADAIDLPFAANSVDAIVLDAPCSASGILRRHPDAKFLQDQNAVEKLSGLQLEMLNASLRILKADAAMLYAVCSIHPQENEQVLMALHHTKALQMQRLFPAVDHDGFFYASIKKAAA
ncbi:MAG: transcription antitermination factor NusB [Mariprofundus sp.]|nr:transcription antitermination factor NusB [Mariprofundus sp.]